MHDCAESGSLEILKLLLSSGAKFAEDSYGVVPLLAAAVTGHDEIVNYLISRSDCTSSYKIRALQLLGATYVDKKRDLMSALKLWKKAVFEKHIHHGNGKTEQETKACKKVSAYDNASEVDTIEELNTLISDPDKMRMQALLLREQILGPAHPDTSYYIRYRGAVYADLGHFDRCITLWNYALDLQQENLGPMNLMTQSSFLSFAELFYFMGIDCQNRNVGTVTFTDIFLVLTKAVKELKSGVDYLRGGKATDKEMQNFDRLLVIVMHLLSLTSVKIVAFTEREQYLLRKKVYELVKLDARGANQATPLHLACSEKTSTVGKYPVCSFPSTDVAKLLLDSGASPNSADADGNTPLHIAAKNKLLKGEMIHLLLMNGAHLDATNKHNQSTYDKIVSASNITVNPLQFTNLQCLCARKVKQNNIAYKGCISKKLEAFVDHH